ncbi:MAG: hypothetical protein FJ399_06710 [Verrucomicrobia bacterium]|nr:hypothetical protein [Verrucomicrobiota bacterium]
MPTLSMAALTLLRARRHPVTAVHYGILPRYMRAICRVLHVPERWLAGGFGVVFGCSVLRIRHENGVPNYPEINLRAMEAVVPAVGHLESLLAADPAVEAMAFLFGRGSSVAYALKKISHATVWPHFLQIATCTRAGAGKAGPVLAVWPASWPCEWQAAMQAAEGYVTFQSFCWPRWYATLAGIVARVGWWLATAVRLLWATAAPAAAGRSPVLTSPRYRLVTEFIEPERLKGGPYDADCWIDGDAIKPADVLFFVGRRQEKTLAKLAVSRAQVESLFRARGYALVWLADLCVPARLAREAWRALFRWLPFRGTAAGGEVLATALERWLELAPLAANIRADNLIYPQFPNGNTSWRIDAALVAGICWRFKIRSVGCQTRIVYATHYEFAFECCDLFLAWGSAWYEALRPAMKFVREIREVGCLTLDALQHSRLKSSGTALPDEWLVLIFPGDIGGSHYTLDYNVSFLRACLALAKRHPRAKFIVKCKNVADAGVFSSHPALKDLLPGLPNVQLVAAARHSYAELLSAAAVVLALGFTTPGTEALLLGKPAVYYSELGTGGDAFAANPRWVVRSGDELSAAFDEIWARRPPPDSAALDRLDRFRDASALARARTSL